MSMMQALMIGKRDTTFVDSIIGSSLSSGVTSVAIPAHQSGDLILAFGSASGTGTAPTATAGWTSLLTYNNNPTFTSNDRATRVVYKFGDGTAQTLTFTGAGSSASAYSGAIIFRNVNAIGNFASTSASTTVASSTFSAPAISPLTYYPSTIVIFSYVPVISSTSIAGGIATNGMVYVPDQTSFAGGTVNLSPSSFRIGCSIEIY